MHLYLKSLTFVLIVCLSAPCLSQELMFDEPIRFSKENGLSNLSGHAIWNGSEWGILYRSYSNLEYYVYFLRVSPTGKVIGKQKAIFKKKGNLVPKSFKLCAGKESWGVVIRWENEITKKNDLNFYVINKSGKIIGGPVILYKNMERTTDMYPFWNGVNFTAPYTIESDQGKLSLLMAFISPKGKRISKDIQIKNNAIDAFYIPRYAISPDGIGFVGTKMVNGTQTHYVFCKVDFEGNTIIPLKELSDPYKGYRFYRALIWDGSKFVIAAQDGKSFDTSKPYVRAVSEKGKWIGKNKYIPNSNDFVILGLAQSGDKNIAIAYRRNKNEGYYRVLNSDFKPAGPYKIFQKSGYSGGTIHGTGITFALCFYTFDNTKPTPAHVYFNLLEMPYKGKPDIESFTAKKVTYFGKDHALLSWKVNGTDSVEITAKGLKGLKPNEGIYFYKLKKKTTFKMTSRNANGKRQAEITVKP